VHHHRQASLDKGRAIVNYNGIYFFIITHVCDSNKKPQKREKELLKKQMGELEKKVFWKE